MFKRRASEMLGCVQDSIDAATKTLMADINTSTTQTTTSPSSKKAKPSPTRTSSRISDRKSGKSDKLTIPERMKRAKRYIELRDENDHQQLQIFFELPENKSEPSKQQLRSDAKRLRA